MNATRVGINAFFEELHSVKLIGCDMVGGAVFEIVTANISLVHHPVHDRTDQPEFPFLHQRCHEGTALIVFALLFLPIDIAVLLEQLGVMLNQQSGDVFDVSFVSLHMFNQLAVICNGFNANIALIRPAVKCPAAYYAIEKFLGLGFADAQTLRDIIQELSGLGAIRIESAKFADINSICLKDGTQQRRMAFGNIKVVVMIANECIANDTRDATQPERTLGIDAAEFGFPA